MIRYRSTKSTEKRDLPVVHCPLQSCIYATPNVDADLSTVYASMLILPNIVNINANISYSKPKLPKMNLPRVGREYSKKDWNTFLQKWTIFKDNKEMSEPE